MAPSPKAPRMSQFVVAKCIALRDTGLSLRKIAAHRLVKKRDGKPPTQQAVRAALLMHKTYRKSAQWALNGAGKRRLGGRGKKISKDVRPTPGPTGTSTRCARRPPRAGCGSCTRRVTTGW